MRLHSHTGGSARAQSRRRRLPLQPQRSAVAQGIAAMAVSERAAHVAAGLSHEMADALTLVLAARRRAAAPTEVAQLAALTAAAGGAGRIEAAIALAEQTLRLARATPQIVEAAPGHLFTAVLEAQSALRTEAKLPYGKPLEDPQRRRAIQHVVATWTDAPRTSDKPPVPRVSTKAAEFLGGGAARFSDDVATGSRMREAFTSSSGLRHVVNSDCAPAQSVDAFCVNAVRAAMDLRAFARPGFESGLPEAQQIAARLEPPAFDAAHRALAFAACAHNLHAVARALADAIRDPTLKRGVIAHVEGHHIVAAGIAASEEALATLAEARGETALAAERRHDARFHRGA